MIIHSADVTSHHRGSKRCECFAPRRDVPQFGCGSHSRRGREGEARIVVAVVIAVEIVDTLNPETVEVLCRDEPRLSSRPGRLKPEVLADMIASPAYHLLAVRRDGDICATLTLAVYRTPGGIKARIDDIVAEQTEDGRRLPPRCCKRPSGTHRRLAPLTSGSSPSRRCRQRTAHTSDPASPTTALASTTVHYNNDRPGSPERTADQQLSARDQRQIRTLAGQVQHHRLSRKSLHTSMDRDCEG